MSCQILDASLVEVARPSSALAELARPQTNGLCPIYDFGQDIITLVNEIPMITFDNQKLALL
jgi:hypothetical protein